MRDTPHQTSAVTSSKTVARTDSTTVRVVQERLKELGYTEVGNPDGKMGKLTKTAILAFRNENDLPVSDIIDDGLLQALDGASLRNLPRNDAEPAAVRQAVPEVQSNFLTKVGAGTLAGTMATGSITDLASKAEGVRSFISPWKDMFGDIPSWPWLGCGALGRIDIHRSQIIVAAIQRQNLRDQQRH
ncbi:peptidoglycan-binding domain-containing protein [Neorhizobium tomejilense]|uniref:peptidoglycan-binding domain-containing protein n=1 Tax=Neorhizobium tomejilense TaxID=2093828 RepID=UPI003CC947BE